MLVKIRKDFAFLIMVLIIILLLGVMDYLTVWDFSFSIFYLIPISLLSINKNSKILAIVTSSVFAAAIWFISEYTSKHFTSVFFPIWNAFVRLTIFITIGLLLWNLKEKQKKLTLVNDSLKTLNEEKNKFLGIAAHDLRTPITGIYSFSNLLESNPIVSTYPDILKLVTYINKMSHSTLIILQNLLDVSKIESGKIELKIETQDYMEFIRHHISTNQIIANQKGILISFTSEFENIIVDFDRHYLSEVIDNLLSNAIKYSNENCTINVRISITENKQILTEIIDNGKGIQEIEQQNLFNYFQTTSNRPTAGESSTGLGLAISKQIIILHNGEIGVKSEVNKGSNFYFTLPWYS